MVESEAVRRFAHGWTQTVITIGFVPMSAAETEQMLRDCAGQLADAMVGEPFSAEPARAVGEALVAAHFTDSAVLDATLGLLASHLTDLSPQAPHAQMPHTQAPHTRTWHAQTPNARRPVAPAPGPQTPGPQTPDPQQRSAALQSALAAGYANALRTRTFNEQELLSQSIVDALRASEARFQAIFLGAAIGVGITDLNGRIIDINQAYADMLGKPAEALRGRMVADLIHPDDPKRDRRMERLEQMARGDLDHLRMEVEYHRDDRPIWADLTVSLIRDEAGQPRHIVAMAGDITERHLLQERLRRQALHDPLTGLANRRLFAQRLKAAFRAGSRVGICFLDLDRFKYVNDSHGHEVGDQLLVEVARRLQAQAGERSHLVARMGGDEFVVLVSPSEGVAQLADLAKRILDSLAEPVTAGQHRLRVSASIGVVEQAVEHTSPSEITKAGDITLQWAKADGRSRWAFFDEERHARQLARYHLASTMGAAIEADEFIVEYQPLVRLTDNAIRGVEALVRWRHPTLGLLSPDQFITEAEDTGLIVPLGRWVLRRACHQVAEWGDRDLFVSVNVAVQQAQEPGLVEDVAAALSDTGLEPEHLQIELTESAVMASAGPPLEALDRLAAMGVRIAIDDFGTGYSNLAYLRRLPVHSLKLAGTFIEGLRHAGQPDHTDEQIVANLIRLAHAIGLTVTAEAVETEAQADLLRGLGCDLAQGWYLSRAAGPEQIAALLGHPAA